MILPSMIKKTIPGRTIEPLIDCIMAFSGIAAGYHESGSIGSTRHETVVTNVLGARF